MEQVIDYVLSVNYVELIATLSIYITVVIGTFITVAKSIEKLENEKANRFTKAILNVLYKVEAFLELAGIVIKRFNEAKQKVEEAKKVRDKREKEEIDSVVKNDDNELSEEQLKGLREGKWNTDDTNSQ